MKRWRMLETELFQKNGNHRKKLCEKRPGLRWMQHCVIRLRWIGIRSQLDVAPFTTGIGSEMDVAPWSNYKIGIGSQLDVAPWGQFAIGIGSLMDVAPWYKIGMDWDWI